MNILDKNIPDRAHIKKIAKTVVSATVFLLIQFMNEDKVKEILSKINYPGFSRDIVSFGMVSGVEINPNEIVINLSITSQNSEKKLILVGDIEKSDIILVGVSRTSKTPTSIYLANKGFKTSNIPLVNENSLPDKLKRNPKNAIFRPKPNFP